MPIIQRIEVRCDLMGFWLFYFMENEVEVWKDVVGFEGSYEVSNMGRVRRLNYMRTGRVQVLKGGISVGYPSLLLYKAGNYKAVKVHSLVAKAFIDANYREKGLVVNHKDFNRQNNVLSNLEVISQRQNNNQKHLPSSSKYTGVRFDRGIWRSRITVNGRIIDLGSFKTEIEASNYYEAALICINEGRVEDIVIKKREPKGYCFKKGNNKWQVYARENGKNKHLGYFKTEDEAILCIKTRLNENVCQMCVSKTK